MSNPIITKEKALDLHRDMWEWIALQYHNRRSADVDDLMYEYAENNKTYIYNPCCYYNDREIGFNNITEGYCSRCPVKWGTENKCKGTFCEYEFDNEELTSYDGLLVQIRFHGVMSNFIEAKNIAMQIAHLPENVEDNYQNENCRVVEQCQSEY